LKKLKLTTIVLAIVLISAVSFIGVYVQVQNRMENKVKDYELQMGLTGARTITLEVSDKTEEITKDKDGNIVEAEDKKEGENYTTEEVAVNKEEDLTAENYNVAKKIIEKRLSKLGVDNYIIKLNEDTGKISIEIPENSNTDYIVSNISETGKFEIADSKSKEVLMDNNDIKKSNVLYSSQTSGTQVYLNIEFTKEGKEKLKNISNEYAKIEEESNEEENAEETENAEATETNKTEEESESETKQKEITMSIDDNSMITTSFETPIETGSLQLTMGSATTDTDTLNDTIKSATTIATILDTGNLPVQYEVQENEYVEATILNDFSLVKITIGIFIGLLAIILIVKYKKLGIATAFGFIGFVALYLLLIRYTNVGITVEGIVGIVATIILGFVHTFRLTLKAKQNNKKEDLKYELRDTTREFIWKIIPICILSIVFILINWTPIRSFGMTMFWGLALMLIYNTTVLKSLIKILIEEGSEGAKHEE